MCVIIFLSDVAAKTERLAALSKVCGRVCSNGSSVM